MKVVLFRLPSPSWDKVTCVVLPLKVLPLTVYGVYKHVLPEVELNVKVGGSEHPQFRFIGKVDAIQLVLIFITVIV